MKKDNMIIFILAMGLVILCSIIYISSAQSLDKKIYGNEWYRFDGEKGYYITLEIKDGIIKSNGIDFKDCKKYKYNEKNKVISFDCGKSFNLIGLNDNELVIKSDEAEVHYFSSIEDSFNYEFRKYFGKSENEFKDEYVQVKELISTDFSSLLSAFKESKAIGIFYGSNCSNIECFIFDKTLEKLIVKSANIYTYNTNNMGKNQINALYNLSGELDGDKNFYNSSYPRVIIFDNGKLVKSFLVECNGFDCSKYEDIIDLIK